MELRRYISSAFPDGLSYNETAQLCLRLYCSVDGIPRRLHAECTKDNLAEVFARLSNSGFIKGDTLAKSLYGASFHAVNEKGHWIEVIASIFKKGDTVDWEVRESLERMLSSAFDADAAKAIHR